MPTASLASMHELIGVSEPANPTPSSSAAPDLSLLPGSVPDASLTETDDERAHEEEDAEDDTMHEEAGGEELTSEELLAAFHSGGLLTPEQLRALTKIADGL